MSHSFIATGEAYVGVSTIAARASFEAAKTLFSHAVAGLASLQWEQIPLAARDYILAHPGLTSVQVVCVLIAFCPGLVVAPALAGVGFGSLGPVAGSIAATFQGMFGTPIMFSAFQSAAMGGWGVGIIHGVTTSVVAVAGVGAEWWKRGA